MLVKIHSDSVLLWHSFHALRPSRDIEVNTAYRWFLGLTLDDKVPHVTTYGKNYSRRLSRMRLD
ncbi:transposase [Streptococcus dysgalactiae]|uniref:transposase n=1 Tax=Streptococcus dysgalactiae TaxID=1334 RepID=UPI0009B5B4A7|nr:transposase [Streptococcus dysgalactiae]